MTWIKIVFCRIFGHRWHYAGWSNPTFAIFPEGHKDAAIAHQWFCYRCPCSTWTFETEEQGKARGRGSLPPPDPFCRIVLVQRVVLWNKKRTEYREKIFVSGATDIHPRNKDDVKFGVYCDTYPEFIKYKKLAGG